MTSDHKQQQKRRTSSTSSAAKQIQQQNNKSSQQQQLQVQQYQQQIKSQNSSTSDISVQQQQIQQQQGERQNDQEDMESLLFAMKLQAEEDMMAQQQLEAQYRETGVDDIDSMTYEQLLELQDKIGFVSKGLTKEQIKLISKQYYNEQMKKFGDVCTICYNDFQEKEKVRILNCEHIFHASCIKNWLKQEKTCPMCKKEITNEELSSYANSRQASAVKNNEQNKSDLLINQESDQQQQQVNKQLQFNQSQKLELEIEQEEEEELDDQYQRKKRQIHKQQSLNIDEQAVKSNLNDQFSPENRQSTSKYRQYYQSARKSSYIESDFKTHKKMKIHRDDDDFEFEEEDEEEEDLQDDQQKSYKKMQQYLQNKKSLNHSFQDELSRQQNLNYMDNQQSIDSHVQSQKDVDKQELGDEDEEEESKQYQEKELDISPNDIQHLETSSKYKQQHQQLRGSFYRQQQQQQKQIVKKPSFQRKFDFSDDELDIIRNLGSMDQLQTQQETNNIQLPSINQNHQQSLQSQQQQQQQQQQQFQIPSLQQQLQYIQRQVQANHSRNRSRTNSQQTRPN
ncbi:hypothetical protein PPERSA_04428 [Pseudocohnilembus persalinus]|uniref:RING-type domain-containing protein n=1 Tax=Pseudocohnilembus persalinus TaxID=266149 RepID=A0A0V0QRK2_PSEPJ|nr:hypothetical protein PPERSA_04428 [Pseudocohnilembus persalinus]|eukprot:KRX04613.1 hypothetical protein PPERSA_04428 [Pseudocohnilembus persalinus]